METKYKYWFWERERVWDKRNLTLCLTLNFVAIVFIPSVVYFYYSLVPCTLSLILFGGAGTVVLSLLLVLLVGSLIRKDLSCYTFASKEKK